MKNVFGWFILQFKLSSKIKLFVPLVKGVQLLTNVTKNSILDVAGVLDQPLRKKKIYHFIIKVVFISFDVIKYLYTPRKVLAFRLQY